MYYILNYFPLVIQALIFAIPAANINFALCAIYNLLLIPVYLISINIYYLHKKRLSYLRSIAFMISVITANIFMFMISHKIQTGYFIGDVPEQIYYLLFIVPTFIILLGVLIVYVKDNR